MLRRIWARSARHFVSLSIRPSEAFAASAVESMATCPSRLLGVLKEQRGMRRQALLGTVDFKRLLKKQASHVQAAFANGASAIGKAHPFLKGIRNEIAAHVLENAVQATLERIDGEAFGFLDVGPRANLTHYKFAAGLTAEMLLKDVSKEERRDISSRKFALIAELLPTFSLIEQCLMMY